MSCSVGVILQPCILSTDISPTLDFSVGPASGINQCDSSPAYTVGYEKHCFTATTRDPLYFSTPFFFSFIYLQDSYFFTDHFAVSLPDLCLLMVRVSRIDCFQGITIHNTPLSPLTTSQIQKMLDTLGRAQLGGSGPAETPCKAGRVTGLASAWCEMAS